MQNILSISNSRNFLLISAVLLLTACGLEIKETKDSIYSRHLQKDIDLTIISTPVPKEKNSFNLLLLNDGQDIESLRVKEIIDSLYRKKLLQPYEGPY
jgi:enterochelin esterase-like enzyme